MSEAPSSEEVRAALERVLSGPMFGRARRAQAFLRFITEETLAGRAAGITGYTIAIAAFGRAADFDAQSDPLVRVEAGRLRSRLLEHYATAGVEDPVRIELERGSYVPSFVYTAQSQPKLAPPPAAETVQSPLRSPAHVGSRLTGRVGVGLGLFGLLLVVALAMFFERVETGSGVDTRVVASRARVGPRIFVQPFRSGGDQQSLALAFGMTEEIMTRLGRYRDVQVFVGSSGYFDGGAPSVEPVDGTKVDYLLAGFLRETEQAIHVEPRLVDVRTGQLVWTKAYDEPLGVVNEWNIVDAVANSVATTVGEPFGPLYSAEVARVEDATVQNVDAYHCTLRFLFAIQTMSESAHGRATECFEHVVASDPKSSMSWARLASMYRMEYMHDFNAKPDRPPALDRALEAARKALDLDHDNAFAYQELGFISMLRDEPAAAEEALARALALNPSADLRAAIGVNLVKLGDTERGFAMIAQGMAESPRAPPFFFLGYVVNALRIHDDEQAFKWADRMVTPEWPLSQAVLAAVAVRTGRDDVARRAAQRLLELRPNFAQNGRELIARSRLGTEAEAVLAEGLARLGIVLR